MNKKYTDLINTPSKKLASIVTCAALVLTLGTTSVFADDAAKKGMADNKIGNIILSNMPFNRAVTDFNFGVETSATTDDDAASQDVVKKGVYYSSYGDKSLDGETSEDVVSTTTTVMVKNENDLYYYSTDGGETWVEFIPENLDGNNEIIVERVDR